jgi:hypothetical protein
MSRRFLAAAGLLVLAALPCALRAVESAPPAFAGSTPEVPPVPAVVPASDQERTAILEAVAAAEAEKDKAKAADAMLKAITQMIERKHADFVPAIKKALDGGSEDLVVAAVRAAATHELKDEEKRIRKLMRTKPKAVQKGSTGAVPGATVAACVDYLARLGIAGEEQYVFEEQLRLFIYDERRVKSSWGPDMAAACLHYLGKNKYKRCVKFLIEEMLAEPHPKNPSDPKNPPASYWEGRHTLWTASEGWVRWALKEITGQEFRTAREWNAWLERNEKDLEKGK